MNAKVRRDEVLERHLRTVSSSLFPNNKLQERAVNVTSLLVRYGPSLVRLLDERLETEPGVHQVVEL